MRILHFTRSKGLEGASKSAYFLNLLLQKAGIESEIINAQETRDSVTWLVSRQDRFDLLHVHWFFNDLENYTLINSIKKPVVWSLRDFSAFTGHCYFPIDCEKYLDLCHTCPQLKASGPQDKSFKVFSFKRSSWNFAHIKFVAPSAFMLSKASRSAILEKSQILIIPNSIDFSIYKILPQPRKTNIVLGFCATQIENYNKGFLFFWDVIMNLLETLSERTKNKLKIYIIGNWDKKNAFLKNQKNILHFPYINNDIKLAEIFNQIDIMILPSLQESFSRVTLEAQACGVPVITFKGNGADEIIENETTGCLARIGDLSDLVEKTKLAIKKVIKEEFDKKYISKLAKEKFSNEKYRDEYLKLYKSMINP